MKEFTSMGAFSEYLLKLALEQVVAERAGLTEACRILKKEARHEIGTYQDEAGPFVAWADLADSTKVERVSLGYTEDDPGLRSGEMRDSIDYRVEVHEAAVGSDNDKLVWFELGTDKQPPRSVLGMAAVHKGEEVAEVIGGAVHLALKGEGVFGGVLKIEDEE